jgi:undecaprenyl-diphosphatase
MRVPEHLHKALEWDCACARAMNRVSRYDWCVRLLRLVSRLGDGELWFGSVALCWLFLGTAGERCALHMVLASGLGCLAYAALKRRTGRRRPYASLDDVRLCGQALDEYSFPSGHTLHAVALSSVAIVYFPLAAIVLVPLAALMAVSRVVLGLHYPSDVIAGAALGGLFAALSFWMVAP